MPLACEPTAEREDTGEIREEELYEMLGNSRRRHALRYLCSRSTPVSVGELAEHVAAAENGVPVEEVTPRQRKSVYTSLYQNHLEKMADAGLVRAERRWVDIELTPAAETLDLHTGDVDDANRRGGYSLVLSAAGLVVTAGFLLGVLSSRTVVASAVGLLFLLLFVISASRYRRT